MPGIRGSWFILTLCLTAAPAGAQTIAAPTHEDYGSIAEVGLGGSIVSLPEASAAQTVPEFAPRRSAASIRATRLGSPAN